MKFLFATPAALIALATGMLAGCVDEVATPAVFDVLLESTTFENRLRTPVAIIRDEVVIDTLAAGTARRYELGRRGPVRHAWQVIAPVDERGRKWSEEPRVSLGVQYQIDQRYQITASGPEQSIFTPRIVNLTFRELRLIVNEGEDDQRITDYTIPPNSISALVHAPYFYWHSSSNVVLQDRNSSREYVFRRSDTTLGRRLELQESFLSGSDSLRGSGVTEPLEVR